MEKKRIEMCIEDLANKDYNSLMETIKDKSFEDACDILEGFDLDEEEKCFSFDYQTLSGKIYEKDGKCVLSDKIYFWLTEFYFPIAEISTNEKEPIINFL